MGRYLEIRQEGNVALLRIDRPPANALDPELLEEGHAAVAELLGWKPGAVVITGRNGFFSAGVDLKLAPTFDADGQREMVAGINRLFCDWYSYPGPVVCAVNGHAIAGGLILALCGDHRVCSTEGKLGLTELRAGIPYPAVAMAVVKAELSPPVVRELVLRAELIDPQAALERRIVDELAPPDKVLDRALEVASELAGLPAQAYAHIKGQLRGDTIEYAHGVVAEEDDPLRNAWISEETAGAAGSILSDPKAIAE